MATVGSASIQDDEWFGEGSAFDSGEDLAAALFALAGTSVRASTTAAAVPAPEISWPSFVAPDADPVFVEVERPAGLDGANAAWVAVRRRKRRGFQLQYLVGSIPR